MMDLRYACFVSYHRGVRSLLQQFMNDLTEAFASELDAWFPREMTVYRDTELVAGDRFEEELARVLCQSLCMVLVYTPQYGASNFCQREYAAMKRIERHRLERLGADQQAGRGMIIPVVLRGTRYLPAHLKSRTYLDFSGYTTADQSIIRNKAYVDEIKRVAEHIYELYCKVKHLKVTDDLDCREFELPTGPFDDEWPEASAAAIQEFPY
jgi:hypothetical protein